MSKIGFCIFTIALVFSIKQSIAQKADSVKIDTTLINKLRIDPPKNILPVHSRPLLIRPQPIPVTMLDYQVSYWRKYLTVGVNLNQSAFSNNWSGGGVSSFALGANIDFKAEYNKQPLSYTTELLLIYGISKNKGQFSRKTNDRIFYDNKLATQLSKKWYFFGSVSFESQFDVGYQYSDGVAPLLISKFMSPGYLTEAIGFEYKPVKYIDIRIGTGTARQTFVLDTTIYHNISGNYGVTPGSTFHNDLAFQVVSTINKDIATNMNLQARYALFIPYNNIIHNTTHRLDATLAAKVNRLINVTLNGTVLYDATTNTKVQATQGLALGIIYKFPN
ncbi:DUF3078 domain-containing protein [Mucilaginibacter paludis]|uniref:DUF3078 domain-containing protein n=1 Tax=Mucilaginibacter paludis DSM 18603 TaxID=714943 RepID=H1YG44_9SPHI|nr:DUF3078 domain-containing protein [Mucilaginibacter paludis]EHQ27308.1 hypothetical protein Mucpa_3204 [Mucilaginibacter paludis DSM 18603]